MQNCTDDAELRKLHRIAGATLNCMDHTEKYEPAFSKLIVSSDYILSTTDARRDHEETIKEFSELFADKLPSKS